MVNTASGARKRRLDGTKLPIARAAPALAKSQGYQDAIDAPEALRAYAADLTNFEVWCGKHGLPPMAATPEVVSAYLTAVGEGSAIPTLRRRVAAVIARAYGVGGHRLDAKRPVIRETLRGIKRKHGAPARRWAALTTTKVRKLSLACGIDLAGARDRALFLIGFAGALSRSELLGLDVTHLIWTDDGLKLRVERPKSEKAGEDATIVIPRGRFEEICPVTALQVWLTSAEITAGPLFRKVNRGGVVEPARLSHDAVRQILLKRAARAGLKGTLF